MFISRDAAVESVRLEFKSNAPDKDETLKKLSSFANTIGGWMIEGDPLICGRVSPNTSGAPRRTRPTSTIQSLIPCTQGLPSDFRDFTFCLTR